MQGKAAIRNDHLNCVTSQASQATLPAPVACLFLPLYPHLSGCGTTSSEVITRHLWALWVATAARTSTIMMHCSHTQPQALMNGWTYEAPSMLIAVSERHGQVQGWVANMNTGGGYWMQLLTHMTHGVVAEALHLTWPPCTYSSQEFPPRQ